MNSRFRLGLALVAAVLSLPAWAEQKVLLDKSEIRFVARQMNVPTEGRFRKFSAEVSFDTARPEAAQAKIDVDLGSVDLASEEGETEVKRKPWFGVEVFPKASFVASGAKALGGGKFEMPGKLTLKGLTREIVLPFSVSQQGGNLVAEGSYTLKRLDFKIGEGAWSDTDTVANEVLVRYRVVLAGAAAKK